MWTTPPHAKSEAWLEILTRKRLLQGQGRQSSQVLRNCQSQRCGETVDCAVNVPGIQYYWAQGTAMEKEVIFQAQSSSVLTDTEWRPRMNSRRSTNFFFLKSFIRKAHRLKSTINPRNLVACKETRQDLSNPEIPRWQHKQKLQHLHTLNWSIFQPC